MSSWNLEEEFKKFYAGLSDSDKLFLALVMGHFTINGRVLGLDLTGEKQIRAFKGLNQLEPPDQFSFCRHWSKQYRYPEQAVLQVLCERAPCLGCQLTLLSHPTMQDRPDIISEWRSGDGAQTVFTELRSR